MSAPKKFAFIELAALKAEDNRRMARHDFFDYQSDELDVHIAMLLTSPSETDPIDDVNTLQALLELRQCIGQDVIFISHFAGNRRIIELVESEPDRVALLEGADDPIEASWCYSVATGRIPELILDARHWVEHGHLPKPPLPIGTHISTPIQLQDASVYGLLCAFSEGPTPHASRHDLCRMRLAAQWLGRRLSEHSKGRGH